MEIDKAINSIEKFFLDIIGLIIPGLFFAIGVAYMINPNILERYFTGDIGKSIPIALLLAIFYTIGHAISSFSKPLIVFSNFSRKILRKNDVSENGVAKRIIDSASLKNSMVEIGFPGTEVRDVRDARNRIISELSVDDINLVRRFAFISLFNIGLATVLSLLLSFSFLGILLHYLGIRIFWQPLNISIMFILFILIFAFIDRYNEFRERSLRTPFSIYVPKKQSSASNP